jgi:hypothetical protein
MSDETPPVTPPAVQPSAAPAAPASPKLPEHTTSATFEPTQAPEGWNQSAWERYQRTRFDNKQLRAQVEQVSQGTSAHQQAIAAAQAEAAKFKAASEKATADLQAQGKRHAQDLVLQGVGGNFGHDSVKRLARSEYDAYASSTTEPTDFGTWLTSDAVKADPLLGVHFPKATTAPDDDDLDEGTDDIDGSGLRLVDASGKVIGTLGQGGTLHTGTAPPPGKSGAKWTNQKIQRLKAQGKWRAGAFRGGKPVGGSAHWQQFMLDGGKIEG